MKKIALFAPSRSGHNMIINSIRSWNPDAIVGNFENMPPSRFQKQKHAIAGHGKKIDWDDSTLSVIVIRDLLNWFASYLMFVPDKENKHYRRMFLLWNDYVNEMLRKTNYLPNKSIILYDWFINDGEYRKIHCEHVGGQYNESELNKVTRGGGYSSFDGKKFINNAQKMKTNIRFRQIMETDHGSRYREILRLNNDVVLFYSNKFVLSENQKSFLVGLFQ